jgi:hypothetical protein
MLSDGSIVPGSPVISATPKTSWFKTMFNFKPQPLLLSIKLNKDEAAKFFETQLTVKIA